MSMNKNMLFFVLFLLVLPFSFAVDYYKPNELVTVSVVCEDFNLPCSSSATCNITALSNPKNVLLYGNQVMNNISNYYYFNFTAPNVLGQYDYSISCVDGSDSNSIQDYFIVNTRGDNESIFESVLAMLIYEIAVVIFFLYFGYRYNNEYLKDVNTDDEDLSIYYFSQGSYILAGIQAFILLGMVYILSLGGNIQILLTINFYLLGITLFGIFIYKGFLLSIGLLNLQKERKAKKEGWESDEWDE